MPRVGDGTGQGAMPPQKQGQQHAEGAQPEGAPEGPGQGAKLEPGQRRGSGK